MTHPHDLVAGIDLGGTKCLGVLATPAGQVIAERQFPVAEAGGAAQALTRATRELVALAEADRASIAGFGIGVPAVIDPTSGHAVRAPHAGWDGFDLQDHLKGLPAPHWIENDVNLAALGEGMSGRARGVADYAVIAVGTGLGGAIVSGGRLLRGSHGAAGELGGLPGLDPQLPGSDLEQTLSGAAIATRVATYLADHPAAAAELASADARAVFEAAANGSAAGADLLAPVLQALAASISALSAVVDPALVILDGSVGRGLAPFLPRVLDLVGRITPCPPEVVVSDLEPSATAIGAVRLALQNLPLSPNREEGAH